MIILLGLFLGAIIIPFFEWNKFHQSLDHCSFHSNRRYYDLACSIGSVEDSFRLHESLQYDVGQAYTQSSLDLRRLFGGKCLFGKYVPSQTWTMIEYIDIYIHKDLGLS